MDDRQTSESKASLNNIVTLKSKLGVTQGHLIERIRVVIRLPL